MFVVFEVTRVPFKLERLKKGGAKYTSHPTTSEMVKNAFKMNSKVEETRSAAKKMCIKDSVVSTNRGSHQQKVN